MSNGRISAVHRYTHWTLLLPVPQDCGQVPACPRKSSRDSLAAAFQGLWKITTHIWHQASPLTTLFQHQRMWPFSRVCWDQVASTVSTKCPFSSGTSFPHVAREPPGPHSVPGSFPFPLEHFPVLSCGVAGSVLPLFTILMDLNPLLCPFLVQSLWLFPIFNFLSSCFWGGVLFPYVSPPTVSLLSLPAKAAPCPLQLLTPHVHLSMPRLC